MEQALVVGDTGGIGSAIRGALEARGVAVTGLSRSRDGFDITDDTVVSAQLGALDRTFDLVFVASGALKVGGHQPEKSLKDIQGRGLLDQFLVNTVGPANVLRHAPRLLPRDRRAVFVALSARVGSIGDNRLGGWYGYRASKAALNQILHGAAIELKRSHRQSIVAALHPGTVATRFTEDYRDGRKVVAPQEAAGNLLQVIDGLSPADSGGFFDWAGKEIPW